MLNYYPYDELVRCIWVYYIGVMYVYLVFIYYNETFMLLIHHLFYILYDNNYFILNRGGWGRFTNNFLLCIGV